MQTKENLQEEIARYMDAGMPIIYIDTLEIGMYRVMLEQMTKDKQRQWAGWSLHSGLRSADISMQGDLLMALQTMDTELSDKIFVIEDIGSQLERPEIVSRLRYIAEEIVAGNIVDCNVVILAPLQSIPQELELYVTLVSTGYLDSEQIKERVQSFCQESGCPVPVPNFLEVLATSLRGLTETEIDNILALAISDDGLLDMGDMPLIRKQKQQMIKKSGILEMVHVRETLEDIGGLEQLKGWLSTKAEIYANMNEAKKWGLDIPKGVLIAGMPGCGKSLAAKAAAKAFDIPLLRMDMGRLMGKYVGESEGNMRRAIHLTEASSPCILWIDELEKAFAGIQSGGSGSEVTTRLFGNFLTWMQEKDSMAFVVATANNISKLPPELMRKGRFDEIFYVDLPNDDERQKILEIHIKKRRPQDLENIDLKKVVAKTKGYCGADMEGLVRDAIESAFVAKKERLDTEDLLAAVERTHPISETMKDSLDAMKNTYKDKKFTNASKR